MFRKETVLAFLTGSISQAYAQDILDRVPQNSTRRKLRRSVDRRSACYKENVDYWGGSNIEEFQAETKEDCLKKCQDKRSACNVFVWSKNRDKTCWLKAVPNFFQIAADHNLGNIAGETRNCEDEFAPGPQERKKVTENDETLCIFPFKFRGTWYTDCKPTDKGDDKTWCPTEQTIFNFDSDWGYCKKSFKDLTGSGEFKVSTVHQGDIPKWGKQHLRTRTDSSSTQNLSWGAFWHSQEENNPWAELHLGCKKFVQKVVVRNRCDGAGPERLEGAWVSVDGKKCGVPFDATVKPCEEKEVTCDLLGRKVKIEILGEPGEDDENKKILNIDMLKAFGSEKCFP